MAVAGAYVLTDELEKAGDDILGALLRYEKRMRPSIERAQEAGRNMANWFVPNNKVRIVIRNLVMRAAGWPITASLLKRLFATENAIEL